MIQFNDFDYQMHLYSLRIDMRQVDYCIETYKTTEFSDDFKEAIAVNLFRIIRNIKKFTPLAYKALFIIDDRMKRDLTQIYKKHKEAIIIGLKDEL